MNTTSFLKIVFWSALFSFQIGLGQSKAEEIEILNWFDATIGVENLDVNKGVLYKSTYITSLENHNFFESKEFQNGMVQYNNQLYYNIDLKYDIVADQLLVLPKKQSEGIEIILEKSKISHFEIFNKKFVLLESFKNENLKFEQGFFEEKFVAKDFSFFIKHKKIILRRIVDDRIDNYFPDDSSFYIFKENDFFKVNSKSDVIKIFPNQKNSIKAFYKNNADLKQKNKEQLMTNLFIEISKK